MRSYFQKLFTQCGLQHKGVFGQLNLILLLAEEQQIQHLKPGILW